MPNYVVTEAPDAAGALFATDRLKDALGFVAAHVGSPGALMVWRPEGPSAGAFAPVVAVPLEIHQAVEVLADGIMDEWDRTWALTQFWR